MGRVVPEDRRAEFREILVGAYRIIYYYVVDEDVVAIAMIYHGAQQFTELPDE